MATGGPVSLAINGTDLLPTTTNPEFAAYWAAYDRTVVLYHIAFGIILSIICIIGIVANILNITALSMIVSNSKLPVYRCFLALSIADIMVSKLLWHHASLSATANKQPNNYDYAILC